MKKPKITTTTESTVHTVTITVGSNELFNTPGVLRWALHAARTDRGWAAQFIAAMLERAPVRTDRLIDVANGIIDGTIPVEYDHDARTISISVRVSDDGMEVTP